MAVSGSSPMDQRELLGELDKRGKKALVLMPCLAIKEDYLESLRELAFPARPVIQNLTTIAQENVHAAQSIYRAIEEHIAKAPPSQKLPALYLLDSISKNIGSPYTVYFGKDLYNTFINAYTTVEPLQRRKFEEMFQTWKQPSPNSTASGPLFSPEVIRKIDNALLRIRTATLQIQQEQQKRYGNYMAPQNMPTGNPYAVSAGPNTFPSLPSGNQFSTARQTPCDAPPPSSYYGNQNNMAQSSVLGLEPLIMSLPSNAPAIPSDVGQLINDLSAIRGQDCPPLNFFESTNHHGNGTRNANSTLVTMPNLQSSLHIPSMPSLSTKGGVSLTAVANGGNPIPPLTFSKHVVLTNISLQQPRPYLVPLLYDVYALKCGACGRRFADTVEGRNDRQNHLDWHFSLNTRIKLLADRNINRNWYLTEEDWISLPDEDPSIISVKQDAAVVKEGIKPEPAHFVKVPTDPVAASLPCPICQEQFQSEWDEQFEEWVWRNAVIVNSKIYHLTCFNELKQSHNLSSHTPSNGVLGKRKAVSLVFLKLGKSLNLKAEPVESMDVKQEG